MVRNSVHLATQPSQSHCHMTGHNSYVEHFSVRPVRTFLESLGKPPVMKIEILFTLGIAQSWAQFLKQIVNRR
jgi:hypothetical protein